MATEVCNYRLSLHGKPVGSHLLRTQKGQQQVKLEARLMLQGSLGQQTITQTSRLQAPDLHSLHFRETLQDRRETRTFEVNFDSESGLVTAKRGSSDQAQIPYDRAYQDPLGLLYQLRHSQAQQLRVPMLGKDVIAERLGDVTLETALGERSAFVFALYPGGNYVYIDSASPHTILQLTQRVDGSLLEAFLVGVSQEEGAFWSDEGHDKGKGKRRSRRRRRRKRRGKRR